MLVVGVCESHHPLSSGSPTGIALSVFSGHGCDAFSLDSAQVGCILLSFVGVVMAHLVTLCELWMVVCLLSFFFLLLLSSSAGGQAACDGTDNSS